MSRSKKREAKAWRREQKRLNASHSRAEHLKREDFGDQTQYQNWWKQMKQVEHTEMIEVPWKWIINNINPITGKKEAIKGGPVRKRKESETENPVSLYAQGGELFMTRDGRTQKLTAMHSVEITDANGKRFKSYPGQVALWTEEQENNERQEQEALKARG